MIFMMRGWLIDLKSEVLDAAWQADSDTDQGSFDATYTYTVSAIFGALNCILF